MKYRSIIVFVLAILIYILISLLGTSLAVEKGTLSRDIDGIDDARYPGIKEQINNLKASHGNYTFLAYYTGLTWDEVLVSEYQYHGVSPLNLFQISTNYNGMWQCPICGSRNYDNGSWCCASLEAIAYMMDPRNSINESDVFQFKDLEGSDASYEDITRAVSGYGAFLNNAEAIGAIYDASREYNINPYFLIAKIINEHGRNGTVLSNGNGYNGNYVGYYNYFNIGSYGNGSAAIINNGLATAQRRGWNSIRASIFGGTAEVKESYITRYSQNTLYYQKFNVSGRSALGSHQYQQNIMAAQSQGTSLKNYYGDSINNNEFIFIIPLYENMPQEACKRPDPSVSNSIQYEDGVIKNISTSLTLRAAPSGTAIGSLNNNESIKIFKRASNEVNGYYWDTILSNKSGMYGYAARSIDGVERISSTSGTQTNTGTASDEKTEPEPEKEEPKEDPDKKDEEPNETDENTPKDYSDSIKLEETEIIIHPEVTVENITKKYENIQIKDANGNVLEDEKIGTGCKIIYNEKEYTVVKKGDVDGNASVNILDAMAMLNSIKGTSTLENEYKQAGLFTSTEDITILDVMNLLNFIKGTNDIEV